MTKDKTVTMSRELAERLARNLASGSEAYSAQEELCKILAAPIVEADGMGEAVAWASMSGDGKVRDLTRRWDIAKHWLGPVEPLYPASQPAPVAVVDETQQKNMRPLWGKPCEEAGHTLKSSELPFPHGTLNWCDTCQKVWQTPVNFEQLKELNQ